jgi:hypothetical protein
MAQLTSSNILPSRYEPIGFIRIDIGLMMAAGYKQPHTTPIGAGNREHGWPFERLHICMSWKHWTTGAILI